ncbi:MAG TPA: carboxypeptidase-like regulatory domain-containing protein [Kofleriaceae bacterium]
MTLRACSQCRRHFAAEPACPFCGAAAPPPAARSLVAGHISRAAVFAGLAGCYTSNPPPQQHGPPPPPPPVEQQQTQQQFATPPGDPPPADPPPAAGTGRIQGLITDSQTRRPIAQLLVQLQSTSAPSRVPASNAQTDPNGRYQFIDLPPGTYVVTSGQGRMGGNQQTVQLADRDVKVVDFQLSTAPQTHLPTPYGAPPVRRRVV